MGIRNAKHKTGGDSRPQNTPAFTESVVQNRGQSGKNSRVSRSTARVTGSGSAGQTR